MTIEAVNSVLSNAPYTKAVAEQVSVAKSLAANPNRIQEAAQQPRFLSLYLKVDVNFDKAILLMRDGDTGDVVRQIPTESQLEAYKRAQTAALQKREIPASQKDFATNVSNGVSVSPAQGGGVPDAPQSSTIKTSAPPVVVEASTSDTSFAPKAGTIVSVDTQA